jgi:hypothetical protein
MFLVHSLWHSIAYWQFKQLSTWMHNYSLQMYYNPKMTFYFHFTSRTYRTIVGIFKSVVIKFVWSRCCKDIFLYVILYVHLVRISNSSSSMKIRIFLSYYSGYGHFYFFKNIPFKGTIKVYTFIYIWNLIEGYIYAKSNI